MLSYSEVGFENENFLRTHNDIHPLTEPFSNNHQVIFLPFNLLDIPDKITKFFSESVIYSDRVSKLKNSPEFNEIQRYFFRVSGELEVFTIGRYLG